MDKYFDCMNCEHSLSIDGERLQCSFFNVEVNNSDACMNQTELIKEFPFSFESLNYEDSDHENYRILSSEEIVQELTKLESTIIETELNRFLNQGVD